MLNCFDPYRKFTLSDLQEVYDSDKKEHVEGNEQAGIEKYTYLINEMKLKGDKLILRIEDNQGTKYLKVIDLSRDVVTQYIEGDKFLISGDRRFIWNMQTNEIYDIIDGLSTYFLWPGDLINSHSYTDSDLFNINNDRTIMSTQGTLYLAFNYISMIIDDKLIDLQFKQQYPYLQNGNNFNYLCYKISNYKSILEKIFEKDEDKAKDINEALSNHFQKEEEEQAEKS